MKVLDASLGQNNSARYIPLKNKEHCDKGKKRVPNIAVHTASGFLKNLFIYCM